jgi:dCTP deaminase
MFEDINELQDSGILPSRWLRAAVQDEIIRSEKYRIQEQNFQPASLDLSLGEKAYSLQCSFLPFASTVECKLPELTISEIDIRDGAILEKGRAYLIPLLEELRLPKGIRAKANPKSSTGRLDIFTRVITDFSDRFDEIPENYEGRMYLEVFSRSFTIKVQTRLSLNQLRLFKGDSGSRAGELQEVHQSKPIVFAGTGQPGQLTEPTADNTIGLSVDLTGTADGIGYRAKRNSALLDLSRTNHYHPGDFWEPVYADEDQRLILEPEEFYLLSSTESVGIPPEFAAEMTAYETSSGELRTHYAGFFDPGFGYGEDGRLGGVQPVLEVRAHDVPFMIGPGQKVCTLAFERMLEPPEDWYGPKVGSSYQEAGRILSKHFSPGLATRQFKMFEGRVE